MHPLLQRIIDRVVPAHEPEVSVLVPVYNAERYLRTCLDSLAAQTLERIEFVCIDDGSTDQSGAILHEYANRDKRFRVLSKQNTGYGDSMNQGIAAAQGRWIGICEPDDFAEPAMFETLARAGDSHECDIVKANYFEHADGCDAECRILDSFEYNTAFCPRDNPRILLVRPSIWAALYRTSLIAENGISFTPSPGASFQDTSFGQQCWCAAQRAVLLPDCLLHYRTDNEASSSASGGKVFEVCDEYERTFAFLKQRGPDDLDAFGPALSVMRFGVYCWNYQRIAPEHHLPFAQRWAKEARQAVADGLLDPHQLPGPYPAYLAHLLASPEAFCNAHPAGIEQVGLV